MDGVHFGQEPVVQGEPLGIEEHFEPLVAPGVGFGDLPYEADDQEAPSPLFDFDLTSRIQQPETLLSQAPDIEVNVPTQDTSEGADAAASAVPQRENYTVSEPADDTRIASEGSDTLVVIDITEGEEIAVDELTFTVEEPITEGRRTEVSMILGDLLSILTERGVQEPESWPTVREASLPGHEHPVEGEANPKIDVQVEVVVDTADEEPALGGTIVADDDPEQDEMEVVEDEGAALPVHVSHCLRFFDLCPSTQHNDRAGSCYRPCESCYL